ncbi:MAG: OadG family protein [Nitrospinota bacterium]|nr:OadG family protein [Nitrospinota bacterium]
MSDFESGLILMVLGMTVVFVFLSFLILLVDIMSSTIGKFFPDKVAKVAVPVSKGGEIAAITAAVHKYMGRKK